MPKPVPPVEGCLSRPTKTSARIQLLLLTFFLIAAAALGSAQSVKQNAPGSSAGRLAQQAPFRGVQALPVNYVGATDVKGLLNSGQAHASALACGDFNSDGITDLVVGYEARGGGGVLAVQMGNIDAFAPQSIDSWNALANHQFLSPFVNTASLFSTPAAPNFIATGQFSGHTDIVTAARADKMLYLFAGDGHGNFAAPQAIAVPGQIVSMATGRFGNDAQASTVIVGIRGGAPGVLLYRLKSGTLSLAGSYSLPAPVVSFGFDDLDADGLPDAVMVAGGQVRILHATRKGKAGELQTLSLPFRAAAVTPGFFTQDRNWLRQLAVLDSNGTLHVMVRAEIDPRPWTKAEIGIMRDALIHGRRNPFNRKPSDRLTGAWEEWLSYANAISYSSNDENPLMLRAPISQLGYDDVVAINYRTGETAVVTPFKDSLQGSSTLLSAGMTAAATMPVGPGQQGLVLVNSGSVSPTVAAPPPPITFVVNQTLTDTVDANPGDGVCDDGTTPGTPSCSLRAAIMEVNAETANALAVNQVPGPFQIMVPAANIQLTIPGAGTGDASTGHLDVNAPVAIVGQDINGTSVTQTDPTDDNDMVFLVDAAEDSTPPFVISFQNLTVQGGHAAAANLLAQGGGIHWEAGAQGTGSLTLTNVNVSGNAADDSGNAGIADGGGLALFNTASVTVPAQVSISGSFVQNNLALNAGGGIALRGGVALTLSSTQVTGNHAQGGGIQQGGGLFLSVSGNRPSGPSQIHASTISSNFAGSAGKGEGGGIFTDQGLVVDQGSVLLGNQAGGNGGGVATSLSTGAADQVSILASSITGNQAIGGNGGGVVVDAGSSANVALSFNRVFSNTVGTTTNPGTGVANLGAASVAVTDNWWGCNQGPQAAASTKATINIFATGVLSSGSLAPDGSVDAHYSLIASGDLSAPGSSAPVSVAASSPIQPNGPWAKDGPNSKWISPLAAANTGLNPGTYIYQTTFDLTGLDPTTASLNGNIGADNSVVILLNGQVVGNAAGFTGLTPFSIGSGFINGVNTLDFVVTNAGSTSSPTSFRVEFSSATANTANNLCDTVSGPATFAPFVTLTHTANPGAVVEGTDSHLIAAFQDSNPNFAANLNALTNLPVTFTSAVNAFLFGASAATAADGTAHATLEPTINPTSEFPLARADAQIDNAIVTATLGISTFSLTTSVSALTVDPGTPSVSFQANVSAVNGFSGFVGLGISGLPAGAGIISVNPPNFPNGSGSSTVTLNPASLLPGVYPVTVGSCTTAGNPDGFCHTVLLPITVSNFSLSAGNTSPQQVDAGQVSPAFKITGTAVNGFNGNVTFSQSNVSGLPPASKVDFGQASILVADGSTTNTTTMTVQVPATTPFGSYPLTVTGIGPNGVTRTVQVTLNVASFTLGASSPTSLTMPAGNANTLGTATATFSLFAASGQGFSGCVSLQPTIAPTGNEPTLSLSDTQVGVAPGNQQVPGCGTEINTHGQTPFTLTVTTTIFTQPGMYSITIKANSSDGIVQMETLNLVVSPPPPIFVIQSLGATNFGGGTNQFANQFGADFFPLGGFNAPVTMTLQYVSGPALPSGSTLGFVACFQVCFNAQPPYVSTVTVNISQDIEYHALFALISPSNGTLPAGTYTIVLTATSPGTPTRQATYTFTI